MNADLHKKIIKIQRIIQSYNALFASRIFSRVVAASWFQKLNFGDLLTPEILRYFGFFPVFSPIFGFSDVVGVGSILHLVPEEYKGVILGSGFISERDAKKFPKANISLVRGHLTRKLLNAGQSVPIGDPGLIVDLVFSKYIVDVPKTHLLGIVPHYVDKDNEAIHLIKQRYSTSVKIIDVCQKPKFVVCDIARCKYILSSSLHGLIVSDSLSIPNMRICLSDMLIGGDFKFNDYYSAFGFRKGKLKIRGDENLDFLIGHTEAIPGYLVENIKESIVDVFLKYAREIFQ